MADLVDADIVVWCEKTGTMDFVARFYDRVTQMFYSGAGATPLDAIAWLFDEYIARAIHGFGPSMSRDGHATPGSRFAELAAA